MPKTTPKRSDDIDDLIDAALSEEDRSLLERYGREPGYLRQALGMFGGPLGWIIWVTFAASLIAFAGSVYALAQMLAAGETLTAVQWGVGGVVLFQLATFARGFMGDHFEANRLLREIKRLELRLVRMDSGEQEGTTR